MARRCIPSRAAIALCLAVITPGLSKAGPYLGDWGWCWHRSKDCPRGEYSPLHYWTPGWYRIRDNVHPSNLDQYPPGPCTEVPAAFETATYRCRSIPAAPTRPYSEPTGYYGRQVVPD